MVNHRQPYRERVSQLISWGHWFVLFNILLAILVSSRYLLVTDWPATLPGRIYSYVSLVGHSAFLVCVVYLLILFPLSFILPSQRWLRFIAIIIATTGISLLLLDSVVFTRFHLHINSLIWQLLLSSEKNSVTRSGQAIFIVVPVILLIELVFAGWIWQKLRNLTRHRHYVRPFALLLFVAFIATHIMYIWADANFYRPVTMQRANLPLSYPMTARGFLAKHGFLDAQAYQQRQQQQGSPDAPSLQYPLTPLRYQDQGIGYNVLLITIDQLSYHNWQMQMPLLVQFAKDNISFTQHFSSGNQPTGGIFGLFYGISPLYLEGVLAARTPSAFISALNHQNYQLGMFASDGFNNPLYSQALISDFSVPKPHNQPNSRTIMQWQAWLTNYTSTDNRWFSWLSLDGNRGVTDTSNRLQVLDRQIQEVLQTLRHSGQWQNTVIVITAGSGEVLPNTAETFAWSRDRLHVPLLIHWPDTPAQQISHLTDHTDIMVTLMRHLLHVSTATSGYAQGEDLFSVSRKHQWVSSASPGTLAVTTPQMTVILNSNGNYQIYNADGKKLDNDKPPLDLLLQVLTEYNRFIAW